VRGAATGDSGGEAGQGDAPGGRSGEYTLLDFGSGQAGTGQSGTGQRLERWGDVVLMRPDTRATGAPRLDPAAWAAVDARFDGRVGGGRWLPGPGPGDRPPHPFAARWPIVHAGLRFAVGCAPSGHTGLFPEQAAHWAWMAARLDAKPASATPLSILNLFAHTGGASVALARSGARVTHVDASRPAIGWAQENAALNGVSTIRWIHDDARRFVDREGRRGRRYDGLLLDPPAFGRGPAGDWQLDRDLDGLLEAAVALLAPRPAFVVVNVYTGSPAGDALERLLGWALDARPDGADAVTSGGTLWLTADDGRRLSTGVFARAGWPWPGSDAPLRGDAE
jgi:23S rRNA (cytosine1962-C5)-methyltransferase